MTFKPKSIVSPDEAFAYLIDLRPNKENAFLMKNVGEYKRRTQQK